MTNATATDVATTVDSYLGMFNETDPGRRAALIHRAWAPEGKYWDPLLVASGYGELSGIAAVAQSQYPGHRFVRTSGIDVHHEFVRFGWKLETPDGSVVVNGLDVGIVNAEGKLTRIVGFFGPLPERE